MRLKQIWHKQQIENKAPNSFRTVSTSKSVQYRCQVSFLVRFQSIEEYMPQPSPLFAQWFFIQRSMNERQTKLYQPNESDMLYIDPSSLVSTFSALIFFFFELDEAFVVCIERKVFRYNHFCIGKLFNILTFYRLHKWSICIIHPVHLCVLCAVHN